MEALAISKHYGLAPYVTEQPPYNLLDRLVENELFPLAQYYNLGLLPWVPLGIGMPVRCCANANAFPKRLKPISMTSCLCWMKFSRLATRLPIFIIREGG